MRGVLKVIDFENAGSREVLAITHTLTFLNGNLIKKPC